MRSHLADHAALVLNLYSYVEETDSEAQTMNNNIFPDASPKFRSKYCNEKKKIGKLQWRSTSGERGSVNGLLVSAIDGLSLVNSQHLLICSDLNTCHFLPGIPAQFAPIRVHPFCDPRPTHGSLWSDLHMPALHTCEDSHGS